MYWLAVLLILPYCILLLKIYNDLLKIRPFTRLSVPATRISVVAACRNEEKNLPSLLRNIDSQDYPPGLIEIIIVDDNSTDNTFEIALAFNGKARLIVLKNHGEGKKAALRTGIEASSGDLIITTDADCTMKKSWLGTIAAFYETHKPDMIICPVVIEPVRGFFGRFQELEFLSLQGVTAGTAAGGDPVMCNGANLAFTPRSYLGKSHNLFNDLPSGDDIFLLHSLKRNSSSKIMWIESWEAAVETASSPTLKTFIAQRGRWLSKWKAYSDTLTRMTGIIVFSAVMTQLSLFIVMLVKPSLSVVFAAFVLLKSVPDILILLNRARSYGKIYLMAWFIPSQFIYPFYVISVIIRTLLPSYGGRFSSPSRKGT